MNDLLAFGGIDFIDAFGQRDSLRGVDGGFLGIDLFIGFNLVRRKKLLRFAAGRSVRAVVTPVHVRHHQISGC